MNIPQPARTFLDPLVWGRGPRVLDVFVEPTCPFSGRALGKFDELLTRAGADRLTLRLRLNSQPWHTFSPVLTRAVLAASTLPGGKDAARVVLAAIQAHRDEFEPEQHCQGVLLDASPTQLLARLEALTGQPLRAAYEDPALTAELKWQARHARQNGIHATPTFMVDGVVNADMSSGDTVDAWLAKLGLAAA
ncbi:MAG: hypothetical protein RIQ60_329 [Pseudomonadota bacterium]|jgi:protein-disulfide isomerase